MIEGILVIMILVSQYSPLKANEKEDIANILSQKMEEARSKQPTEQRITREQWQAADPHRVVALLAFTRRTLRGRFVIWPSSMLCSWQRCTLSHR